MPKAPRSAKQKAADLKKLQDWEAKQAEEARVSNDKEVATAAYTVGYDEGHHVGFIDGFEEKKRLKYVNMFTGFVLGAVTILLACMLALGIVFAV